MRVEFYVRGVESSEELCKRLAGIIHEIADRLTVPFEAIEQVIVATPDTFGDVVGRFDATRKYTNQRGLVAAGKVFTRRPEGARMTHSIILLSEVVASVFRALDRVPEAQDLSATDQRNLYVLFHELGHCLDHERRPLDSDDGTYRTEKGERAVGHSLKDVCAYHHSMLQDELAACVFSAEAYTQGSRTLDCQMNDAFVRTQLFEVRRKTLEDPKDLGPIRYEAAGLFWFILLQQAKHTGSRLGNASLSNETPEKLWQIAATDPKVAALLQKADEAIERALVAYPNFDGSFKDELSTVFVRLAERCGGYRFEDPRGTEGI